MNINIDQAIRDLLYENPVVIVPGLGGFASSPISATVDYVQGIVLPPSRKIEFNQNLVINDGLLVNRLQEQYTITVQEASDQIASYVEQIKSALERRQIVEVQQVGRIYKDFEQKIRFTAEGENFNVEAYGLPSVQFAPLVREKIPSTQATAASNDGAAGSRGHKHPASSQVDAVSSKLTSGLHRLLPWLVLLSALLLAVMVYLKFSDTDTAAEEDGIAKERVETMAPALQEPVATDEVSETAQQEAIPPAAESEASLSAGAAILNENSTPTTQQPAATEQRTAPVQQTTHLVIHSFGVRANATRFARELSKAGYAPETQKVGNLYRVGVIIPHSTQAELEAVKLKLGQQFKAVPKTNQELDEELGR
ncbi:MAG: hypothetical protein RI973_1786 [Bacteroidota bacterium]|jgi:nucleoid DNA-binding protein